MTVHDLTVKKKAVTLIRDGLFRSSALYVVPLRHKTP